ncbi:MAG: hypothetical protein IH831_03190 [Planctomycetes bacterium]|nr:hypothetical protein [Planctomycetota bacterium]
MAKKKRKAPKPPFPKQTASLQTAVHESPQSDVAVLEGTAEQFVGQWNRLVSTTNWEKGRIICQWREALMTNGAAVTEYSDEAWTQLVGGVTSQHVGRLRRVYQRFGEVCDQYPGLYWSHFQAALEWDDAEMWLEGAIRNEWSISQMRGKRWETLGTPPEQQLAEIEADGLDVAPETPETSASADGSAASSQSSTVQPIAAEVAASEKTKSSAKQSPASTATQSPAESSKRIRLKVDVEELPDDLAEAFEAFKLAIIAHRLEGWNETTPAVVVECLDALRELALAE